jgi:peptide/nickel transport system substrate-binding protein
MASRLWEEFTKSELSGPKIDRRTTLRLMGAGALGALAGFVDEDPTEAADTPTQDQMGGRLIAGWNVGAFSNLDPPLATDTKLLRFINNIHRTPLQVKEDFTFEGDLAEDWEVGEDPFSITLMLRDDVTYHNGESMVADHLRFSVRRAIEEDTNAAADVAQLQPLDEGGIEVEDDYRITYRFVEPFAPALSKMAGARGRAFMPYPPSAIEDQQQFNLEPVGTGPFEVVNHIPGEVLELEAFDDYYGTDEDGNQLPYLDALNVRFVPEPAQLINAIRGGDIDVIDQVPFVNVDEVESFNNVTVEQNPGMGYESAVPKVNNALDGGPEREPNEPFSDQRFRQGLSKLVDREEYIQQALGGNGTPEVGPIHKSLEWVYRSETGDEEFGGELKDPTQNFAPEEGKSIIEETVETPFSFEITVPESDRRTGRVLVRQFNENSDGLLEVELNQVTDAQWGEVLTTGDWDMSMAGSGNVVDPDAAVFNFFRWDHQFGEAEEGYDGVWNEGHYMNSEVHKLIGEQRRTLDREERKQVFWELEDRLINDVARIWIFNADDVMARRNAVSEVGTTANQRRFWTTTISN